MLLPEIEKRRSRRAYKDSPVSGSMITDLKEAVRFAPSCANKQSARYVFVESDTARTAFAEALAPGNYWAARAPLFVVAVARHTDACMLNADRNYAPLDVGLGVQNLLLQAVHLGLLAHPMAGFDPLKVRSILEIPEDFIPWVVVAIGWQSEDLSGLNEKHREAETGPRQLKPMEETISKDAWKF